MGKVTHQEIYILEKWMWLPPDSLNQKYYHILSATSDSSGC